MHPVISANNPLLNMFQLNVTVVQSDRPGRDWVQCIPDYNTYDRHTEYLDPRIDTELVGFLKNWQYFGHVKRDLMQNHFRFREAIKEIQPVAIRCRRDRSAHQANRFTNQTYTKWILQLDTRQGVLQSRYRVFQPLV